jgi:hypothetical protein
MGHGSQIQRKEEWTENAKEAWLLLHPDEPLGRAHRCTAAFSMYYLFVVVSFTTHFPIS